MLCSHFLLSYGNQAMTKSTNLTIGGHGYVICMSNLGGFFSQENTPERLTETTKVHLFHINKYVGEMVIT